MKIDIVIAVAERGGVENAINQIAVYLKQRHEIRIIQLVWEGVRWTAPEVRFYPLLYGREGHDLEEFIAAYRSFLEQEEVPDIILAAAWPYMSVVAKLAAEQMERQIPVISWLHAPVERYQAAGYGGYESLAYADAHFAISQSIYNAICRKGRERVYLVSNPVDFSEIPLVERNTKHECERKICYIGRISPEKHLEVVIRALARTREAWELTVIGSGEEVLLQKLFREAENLGVAERIKWLGWQEEPWEFVGSEDVIVLASEYEGLPLVVIEALACGRTVISTPTEGVKELIIPGKTGYLFDFGDSGMLAEVLDAIQAGILKKVNPVTCRSMVAGYESSHALQDFEEKLQNCLGNFLRK